MVSSIVQNADLLLEFDHDGGITLEQVYDKRLQRNYLLRRTPLFKFAANNANAEILSRDPSVWGGGARIVSATPDSVVLTLQARYGSLALDFTLTVRVDPRDPVATLKLVILNVGRDEIFLRLVFPEVLTLNPKWAIMGMIPQETGSVVPLSAAECSLALEGAALGPPLNVDVGLPPGRNTMELVSIYDPTDGGGIFFADMDGDLDRGVSPIQFTLCSEELAGFSIMNLLPGTPVSVPRLAIGVNHAGDWHNAVDFYVKQHRPRWNFPSIPTWLRDAGAIYTFSGGGAGGGYLGAPIVNLSDGAIWTSFVVDDDWYPRRGGSSEWPVPIPITVAGLAPAGAPVAAVKRDEHQLDLFVVDREGAVQTTFNLDNGPWQPEPVRLAEFAFASPAPIRLTDPWSAPPGGHLAAILRSWSQLDLFFVDTFGAVQTTFVGRAPDGQWARWHTPEHRPFQLTERGFAPGGAPLTPLLRNADQLDLFVIGNDQGVHVISVRRRADGLWSAWDPPQLLPGTLGLARAGAEIAAVKRNDRQLDVFFVGSADGALWTSWLLDTGDARWVPAPVQLPGTAGRASVEGSLVALKRDARQLDVFFVGTNGHVWTTFVLDLGRAPWHDAPIELPFQPQNTNGGPPLPQLRLAAGAGIAAVMRRDRQLDVFLVNGDGSVWTNFITLLDNGLWEAWEVHAPIPLTLPNHVPAGACIAAIRRSARQLDVFVVAQGRISSFHELPKLLREANALGTNIIYMWDYWAWAPDGAWPAYWNKGDYIPRADLGGEAAFREGIRAIKEAGGRVILYVEPFILYPGSKFGQARGQQIEAWDFFGSMFEKHPDRGYDNPYPGYYKMLPTSGEWRSHLNETVRRLVGDYGADGIVLDSWGWQWNWPWFAHNDPRMTPGNRPPFFPHVELSREFNQGVLALADEVRNTVQSICPDGVILCECTGGPMMTHLHGGFSSEFSFRRASNQGRIIASPVRYGIREAHFISPAAASLNELHQIFAAGHSLGLAANSFGTWVETAAARINWLVQRRQRFKDALIYGEQPYQPDTSNPDVIAYFFQGLTTQLITVVNISDRDVSNVNLHLRPEHDNSDWQGYHWADSPSGEATFTLRTRSWTPQIRVQAHDILVLVRVLPRVLST